MQEKALKLKADTIRWHQLSRRGDAIFRSLGREIVITTLSAAALLTLTPTASRAQIATQRDGETSREVKTDEVTVTASRVPLPMTQTARIVSVMTREQIEDCPAQSVNDLLKYATAVDVRQRGAFGIQTDISINGGTHDQIVILLNGVNISSPHTGHLSADFPVSMDDIERIEILEGAASRVYGTSAFSGAINIVTKGGLERSAHDGKQTHAEVGLTAGSFGSFGADGRVSMAKRTWSHTLSGGYQRSDGATAHSDFDKLRAFYRGSTAWRGDDAQLPSGTIDWQIGASGMNYGANTFYSGKFPNQYEENRRFLCSVGAHTEGKVSLTPTLYFNRSLDHFQLIKGTRTGENFHETDVYGASLNARVQWSGGVTAVGAELRSENILSTTLGRPMAEDEYVTIAGHRDRQYTHRDSRSNLCYFVEHDIVLDKWTCSVGLMANRNSGLDHRFRLYPGVDVSFRPSPRVRLYASWNMAQRMPTFTDLYYKSPTQEGNTGLKPERTSEFSLGGTWRTTGLKATASVFYRRGRNMIDWVVTPADSVNGFSTFHASNFSLDNAGVNINAELLFREWLGANAALNSLLVSYNYLHQKRKDHQEVVAACYALDYLRHKLVARLDTRIYSKLSATVAFRWQDRCGNFVKYSPVKNAEGTVVYQASTQTYSPFGLLDLRLNWKDRHYEFYAEANNLTSRRYYDVGNVLLPGCWMMAGAKLKF